MRLERRGIDGTAELQCKSISPRGKSAALLRYLRVSERLAYVGPHLRGGQLGLSTTADLVQYAIRHGIISADCPHRRLLDVAFFLPHEDLPNPTRQRVDVNIDTSSLTRRVRKGTQLQGLRVGYDKSATSSSKGFQRRFMGPMLLEATRSSGGSQALIVE